jgi:hypothetical protein
MGPRRILSTLTQHLVERASAALGTRDEDDRFATGHLPVTWTTNFFYVHLDRL